MSDIVKELRQASLNQGDYRWQAADEIERLRKEIERLRDDYANRLLGICADSRRFMDERDAAIKQRDEARQLYCGAVEKIQHGITNETKRSVADFLGWDCYKENKENTNG